MNEYLIKLRLKLKFGEKALDLIMMNNIKGTKAKDYIRNFFNERFCGCEVVEIIDIEKSYLKKRGIRRIKKKKMLTKR